MQRGFNKVSVNFHSTLVAFTANKVLMAFLQPQTFLVEASSVLQLETSSFVSQKEQKQVVLAFYSYNTFCFSKEQYRYRTIQLTMALETRNHSRLCKPLNHRKMCSVRWQKVK